MQAVSVAICVAGTIIFLCMCLCVCVCVCVCVCLGCMLSLTAGSTCIWESSSHTPQPGQRHRVPGCPGLGSSTWSGVAAGPRDAGSGSSSINGKRTGTRSYTYVVV